MNRRAALLTPLALLAGAAVPAPKLKIYDVFVYPSLTEADIVLHAVGPSADAPIYEIKRSRGAVGKPWPADAREQLLESLNKNLGYRIL